MKAINVMIALLAFSALSPVVYGATGHSTGKVHTLLWYEGHIGLLIKQDGMSDLGDCGRADYYILDKDHPFFKEVYSLILSAHVTSHPLKITVGGCVQGISRIKHVASVNRT